MKLPGGFRIFWSHWNCTVRLQVLGYKKLSNFWLCVDLGHILKNRVLAPIAPNVNFEGNISFQIPQN